MKEETYSGAMMSEEVRAVRRPRSLSSCVLELLRLYEVTLEVGIVCRFV